MDSRKLQLTGGSTITVSLPRKWVDEAGLERGAEVVLVPQSNGTLVVDPRASGQGWEKQRKLRVHNEVGEHLFRRLIGIYLTGTTEISVEAATRFSVRQRSTIREFSASVIGIEIVEEEASRILLNDVTSPGALPFDRTVKRLYRIVRAMYDDAVQMLHGSGMEAAEVSDRDREADKLYWFIERQFNMTLENVQLAEKVAGGLPHGQFFSHVARALERIGDHACRLAEAAETLPQPDTRLLKLADQAGDILEEAMVSFSGLKAGSAVEIIDRGKAYRDRCQRYLQQRAAKAPDEALPLFMALESLIRTALYSTDIAEATINFASQD